MAIIAYLRVSHEEQAASGLGLDAQLESITRVIGTPSRVFRDEGISGSKPNRPGMLAALDCLQEGDTLAIAKLDRLARDLMLSCWIDKEAKKRGARIVSSSGEGTEDDSPSSVLMRQIVQSFAEYEKSIIGARTAAALAQKRAKREKTGGLTPFGFTAMPPNPTEAAAAILRGTTAPQTLIPNPAEMNALDIIKQMHNQKKSLRKICAELESRGIPTKTGKTTWHPQVIKQVLSSKLS
jgi:DNA invertase Pin-like site-specific DNA recombinase